MDQENGVTEDSKGVDEVFQNYIPSFETDMGLETSEGDALGKPGGRAQEFHAKMPVTKYATHYKMDHKKRGLAYIFNHEIFECGGLKARTGTNEDCRNLKECLVWLGFDVQVFKDLNLSDIQFHVRQAANMDHNHHDCILVAVLSHGEMGIIYAKDTAYKPDLFWSSFTADKCPTLAVAIYQADLIENDISYLSPVANIITEQNQLRFTEVDPVPSTSRSTTDGEIGKPKMFFLQACQGDKLDSGINLSHTETDGEVHNTYRIPVQADFLIVYSTVKGYYSWRNTTKGSWFVQSLCEELRRRAPNCDLLTILTFVSQRVAIDYESNVPDSATMHRQKQIPCVMSMLTRLIHFKLPTSSKYI